MIKAFKTLAIMTGIICFISIATLVCVHIIKGYKKLRHKVISIKKVLF